MTDTRAYEGMIAETITVQGDGGDSIYAYLARPLGAGPFPAMLLLHHIPGWDEWYRETARRYAHHGYVTICPDLYFRDGQGEPEDVAAKVRAEGGAPTTASSAMPTAASPTSAPCPTSPARSA